MALGQVKADARDGAVLFHHFQKVVPRDVSHQVFRIADDDRQCLGAGQRDIEPSRVGQKSDRGAIGPYGRYDDDRFLPPLVLVHRADLNVVQPERG